MKTLSALFNDRGYSLLELMIALGITGIISGAAYTVMSSSQKTATANDQTTEMQQNARIAMDLLAQDLKMAGYGQTPITGCGSGIVPADNTPTGADTGPDGVSMIVPTPLSSLIAAAGTGGNTVQMVAGAVVAINAAFAPEVFGVGSFVSLGGTGAVAVQSLASDTLTTTSNFSITSVYPVGTPVMWLRCVTYAIGTTAAKCGNAPCLLRGLRNTGTYANVNNDPGMIPIAEGIEDLQLAYACDGCNGSVADGIIDDQDASGTFTAGDFISNSTWAASPTTPDTIRLVRISLVARQSGLDLQTGDTNRARAATPNPIVAEDHNPSSDAGFSLTSYQWQRRRLVTRTVQLRNMGL